MFESDDFDQFLSQFDFPEMPMKQPEGSDIKEDRNLNHQASLSNSLTEHNVEIQSLVNKIVTKDCTQSQSLQSETFKPPSSNDNTNIFISPKHTKRKVINSHFDHKIKRKFPGPAGLLTGSIENTKDDTICHMEFLSQDIEFSQNSFRGDLFESPLWLRLLEDIEGWNLQNIDDIKSIKQQALAGNLRRRKAQTVTAFVETVDRSAIDPLVILRDATGHIKCTLHRDAWSLFSTYIVSEYCALVLWKPTVLTTGGAFKKHYLNITLSNIYAIYSSTVVKEEDRNLLDGYVIVTEDDYTVIKTGFAPDDSEMNLNGCNELNGATAENDLQDLDSIFSDDLF